ncbi:MAG: hypothetical protein K5637_05875 [Lachnospiraceae bacterium]|nr:hypothetical protein [Lachnospiraceae bacterium]
MMYGYMTLEDNTEIVHSEMKPDGTVKVYIEKPVYGGFHHATCWLPVYIWEDVEGFSDEDMLRLKKIVENNAHLIMEFSQKGGVLDAANY